MNENNLTPEESFTIISKSIATIKMNYKENAKVFLLWGWMLSLSSFSNYIILKILHSQEAYNLMGLYSMGNWLVFCIITFTVQYFMLRKIIKDKKVYSYLDGYIKNLWKVTAASFFIAAFVCIRLEIPPPAIMLLIGGIATTTTGIFIKFKPMIIGGMAFFIFSIATTFVENENIALMVGLSIICGYLIPGYLLKFAKD